MSGVKCRLSIAGGGGGGGYISGGFVLSPPML